jgi:S-adenosylmethionine-diacylglycerol 3-amino-3-carboxypropyl transferase
MRARDLLFHATWKRLFVYNILFEDSEVDEAFLGIDERSRVLSISGAGCGVASMLTSRPAKMDVCDINRHHLALTALKCEALRRAGSYGLFYDLFGRGWHPDPEPAVRHLASHLPTWMQKHWKESHGLFRRTLYREGVTSRMLSAFRRLSGVDEAWLRSVMPLSPDRRARAVEERIAPALRSPMGRAWMRSPAQLMALGVNYHQRERLVGEDGDLGEHIVSHLVALARTDVETNWFVWFAIAGQFNHDRQDAVPPYLRRDRFERTRGTPTEITYHPRNVFDVLDDAAPGSYTHFTLCDAPDWLSTADQRRLLDRVATTATDGATVLVRTVGDDCMVTKLGLEKRFVPQTKESNLMTSLDRTRQYRRVQLYRVAQA